MLIKRFVWLYIKNYPLWKNIDTNHKVIARILIIYLTHVCVLNITTMFSSKVGNTDDKQIPCARIDFRSAMPTQRLCSSHWLKKVNSNQSRAIINKNSKSLNEIGTWIQNSHKDTNWRACHQDPSVRKAQKQRVKVDLLTIYDNDINSLLVHD